MWGKNGVPVSVKGVAGSGEDISYTHVIGLCWGWRNLPLTELRVSAPPIPKVLLAIKNPPGSCNDPKDKQNGGSKCSLEFQCSYNVQQKANGRETYLSAQWFVLSTIFLMIPSFHNFSLLPFLSFVLSICFLISCNILLSLLNPFYEFSNMFGDCAPS